MIVRRKVFLRVAYFLLVLNVFFGHIHRATPELRLSLSHHSTKSLQKLPFPFSLLLVLHVSPPPSFCMAGSHVRFLWWRPVGMPAKCCNDIKENIAPPSWDTDRWKSLLTPCLSRHSVFSVWVILWTENTFINGILLSFPVFPAVTIMINFFMSLRATPLHPPGACSRTPWPHPDNHVSQRRRINN